MNFALMKHLNFKAFLLLFLLMLLAYSSSFNGDWIFDDYDNIIYNQGVHLSALDFESLKSSIFADLKGEGKLYRPIPMLTFGINWYFSQSNTFGYHLVNFCIHFISAYFLFLSIKLILRTPRFKLIFTNKKQVYIIAFFSALLWAIHPIQIQAVTYIVQRMASMAGMFVIIAIFLFLYGLQQTHFKVKILAFGGCLIAGLCGVLSKENALLLPLFLVLIYWVFYLKGGFFKKHKRIWAVSLVTIFIVLLAGGLVYFFSVKFQANFEIRYFNWWERLLTQSRVIFLYLYQIFWPAPSQFQIEHYVPISTSLFQPLSTFIASLAIIVMLVLAIINARKYPLTSFAILFFFLAHTIESTIIPLELVYEHRNYIPSMFIAVPIVYGFLRLINFIKAKNPSFSRIAVLLGLMVIILIGGVTWLRNGVWQDPKNIYWTAFQKYPRLSRSYSNYGALLRAEGLLVSAFPYYEIAVENQYYHSTFELPGMYVNLINGYVLIKEYDKALNAANYILDNYADVAPKLTPMVWDLAAMAYDAKGDVAKAEEAYKTMLEKFPDFYNGLKGYGLFLLEQERGEDALPVLLKEKELLDNDRLSKYPQYGSLEALANVKAIATAYFIMGRYDEAHKELVDSLQILHAKDQLEVLVLIWVLDEMNDRAKDDLYDFIMERVYPEFIEALSENMLETQGLNPDFQTEFVDILRHEFLNKLENGNIEPAN